MTKFTFGRYRGREWQRRRICDVLHVDCREWWWFATDIDDGSNHFKTQAELFDFIDGYLRSEVASP